MVRHAIIKSRYLNVLGARKTAEASSVICYQCQEKGHIAKSCPEKWKRSSEERFQHQEENRGRRNFRDRNKTQRDRGRAS